MLDAKVLGCHALLRGAGEHGPRGPGGAADLEAALGPGKSAGRCWMSPARSRCRSPSPLWGLENVLITPHLSGDSRSHLPAMAAQFEANLRAYLAGRPLENVVDKQLGFVASRRRRVNRPSRIDGCRKPSRPLPAIRPGWPAPSPKSPPRPSWWAFCCCCSPCSGPDVTWLQGIVAAAFTVGLPFCRHPLAEAARVRDRPPRGGALTAGADPGGVGGVPRPWRAGAGPPGRSGGSLWRDRRRVHRADDLHGGEPGLETLGSLRRRGLRWSGAAGSRSCFRTRPGTAAGIGNRLVADQARRPHTHARCWPGTSPDALPSRPRCCCPDGLRASPASCREWDKVARVRARTGKRAAVKQTMGN